MATTRRSAQSCVVRSSTKILKVRVGIYSAKALWHDFLGTYRDPEVRWTGWKCVERAERSGISYYSSCKGRSDSRLWHFLLAEANFQTTSQQAKFIKQYPLSGSSIGPRSTREKSSAREVQRRMDISSWEQYGDCGKQKPTDDIEENDIGLSH